MLIFTKLLIFIFTGLSFNAFLNIFYSKLLNNQNFSQISSDSCLCFGENFCFQGLDDNGTTMNGFKFDCDSYEGLKSNKLLDSDAISTKNDFENLNDLWQPIFVTSISSNHFEEGRKFVKTIAFYYPDSKIVVYDIGMEQIEIDELKSWCNVEYKKFHFDKYPLYFRDLKTYAFKIVIIETIQIYKTFFYFDTSIRITGKNMLNFLHGVQNKTLMPHSFYTFAPHSVFSTTHKDMFDYLPLPLVITEMKEIKSTQFVSDSPYTRYILKWWYLCAMTKDCIAPNGSNSNCNMKNYKNAKHIYMNCHRYDQSFWNIVSLAYLFGNKRGALELGYTSKNWTNLSAELVSQVEQAQATKMKSFFELLETKRGDILSYRLELRCRK